MSIITSPCPKAAAVAAFDPEAAQRIERHDYEADYLASPLRIRTASIVADLVAIHNPKSIVDLGAGTGRLALELRRTLPDCRLALVDLNREMLSVASDHFRGDEAVEIHCASFMKVPLADNSIDIAVSAFAIHHVSDADKFRVAKEIARVLRPGGISVIADQMVFDSRLEGDADRINEQIQAQFYGHREAGYWLTKLGSAREYTVSGIAMEAIWHRAGLLGEAMPITEISGILVARKPFS